MRNITQAFRRHLQDVGYQKSTISMVYGTANAYLQFIDYPKKALITTTGYDIKKYHHYLQHRPNHRRPGGLSERYIHHQMFALRVFFEWLIQQGQLTHNPMAEIQLKAPNKKKRLVLTLEQIKQLYSVTENHKERAILSLFYGCGLRRSEGVDLQVNDLNFSQGLLFVRSGKGNKRRVVPLSKKVKQDLQNYLLLERGYQSKSSYFLVNTLQEKTTGGSCNKILKDLLARCLLPKEISLHSLRHSIATHLLENEVSLEYVRNFLGHTSLETTQIYTQVSPQKIKELT